MTATSSTCTRIIISYEQANRTGCYHTPVIIVRKYEDGTSLEERTFEDSIRRSPRYFEIFKRKVSIRQLSRNHSSLRSFQDNRKVPIKFTHGLHPLRLNWDCSLHSLLLTNGSLHFDNNLTTLAILRYYCFLTQNIDHLHRNLERHDIERTDLFGHLLNN